MLRKKLNSVNNEDFILKEETSINELLDYYLNKQKEISNLPFEQKKFLLNEYNFKSNINIFDSLYSLDLKNFNENKLLDKIKSDNMELLNSIDTTGKLDENNELILTKIIEDLKKENFQTRKYQFQYFHSLHFQNHLQY